MIYLLAILWFASGFLACIYHSVKVQRVDFRVVDLFAAIFWGFGGAFSVWVVLPTRPLLQITLFKARNK